ncbi:hypothetical protein GOBAR_DD07622 [Gossypium barbadense]|nr:hypothetical protein GOBAR_DD07622 [Gossypium barbadense]
MASMILSDPSSAASVHRLSFTRFSNSLVFLRRFVGPLHVFSHTAALPRALSLHAPRSSRFITASAKVIDGKSVAKQIREEISAEVTKLKEAIGVVPGLAVILVGDRKDSATYVRNKKKACESVGIKSFEVNLPNDASEQEVLKYISDFNGDPSVHGILVQLPLPSHMNEQNILNAVMIEKDVDGFHPLNIGRLAMRGREPMFVPCTPKGCIELLHRYGVDIKGKRAVVIGRSNIVGMPAALLLQVMTLLHS